MPVYKDNKGKWYIKYRNRTKRGFSTKKEAEKYEAQMKLTGNELNEQITFDEVAADFLSHKKNSVAYGTYSKYQKTYDDVITNMFPVKTKMSDITKMMCRRFRDKLSESTYSTKSKNMVLTLFRSIVKHGTLYFNVKDNSTMIMERFKPTYDDMMRSKEQEMSVWTVEEFESFICEVKNPVYKTLYIVLYYTGMRLGEALALKWKDYQNNTFDIYKSISYKTDKTLFEEKQPKNANSIRKVKVSNSIASIIEQYHEGEEKIAGYKDSWYIFGRKRPLPPTSIERYKNNACKEANVKRIRIHDFRHSHASYLISQGINIVAVSRRLGHADVNMTLHTYTHLLKDKEDEIVQLLDKTSQNLLNNSLNNKKSL